MRICTKVFAVFLLFISACAAPAAAQPLIYPAGDGSYNVSRDMADDVTKSDNGTFTIDITDGSTLTGDITKDGPQEGTLSVNMEAGSSLVGTTFANGTGNIVNISGGFVTSASGRDVFAVGDDGVINLTGTRARANGSNLVGAMLSGSVLANGSALSGDISNTGMGMLDVTLNSGSTLEGAVLTNSDGGTNLRISNAADSWIVTRSSDLGLGSLENNGTISYGGTGEYITIKAGELGQNGATGGLFDIRMDIVKEAADKLEIANTAAGSYIITAQESDASAKTSGRERINLAEIGGASAASFAMTNDNIELGAWMYALRETTFGTGSAWQIRNNGLSNAASAAVNTVAAGYLLGYAETGTLTQRLGELRDTPLLSGFWARAYGGKFNTDDMRHGKEFDLKYGGIHIGYDRKIETGLPGELYAGVMFGYSKGDIDFSYAGGDGDVDSKTIGVYGTYKQKNGVYVDALLKYQWLEHDFDTFDSKDSYVKTNDASTSGFGFSVEIGQKITFDNGWYATPQAQLSYMRQNDGYFNVTNGLRIGVEGYTSLIGRVGVKVGYENKKHNFYATVSRAKEFEGDLDFYANTMPINDSMSDSWWVYGIGYAAKLNDKNHLYIDIERASGGVFEQDWSVRVGWRIEF